MTVPLTPETLAAGYEYLRTTPPFRGWNLPDAEDVKFIVTKTAADYADHAFDRRSDVHSVSVSEATNGHTASILGSLAHEMIHIHQAQTKMPQNHGRGFKIMANRVCRIHGFDPKSF